LSLEAIEAISGSIIVLDDQERPIESAIVYNKRLFKKTTRQLKPTLDQGLAGWVVRHRQPVLVHDTSLDKRWLRRPDDAIDQTGPKSAVSAPLMARERLVGVMTLVHPIPGFFTKDHIELVQAISDQAGIAVLNARLYEESQRQARVMTAVAESATAITATLNLQDVLQRILEKVVHALQVEAVSLALIDPHTNELEFRAATGIHAQEMIGVRLKIGQGVAGWVAREGRGVIVPQVRQDPRFYPEIDDLTGFDTQAIACAPIRLQGKVIGILEALNPIKQSFTSDALLVMTGIGNLAGTAIHHAQLFQRLETAHRRYQELFEDSIDPIVITDRAGDILEANRQAVVMTDISPEELLRMNIDDLPGIKHEIFAERLEQLDSGETITYETVFATSDEAEIPIHVNVRQVNIDGAFRLQWILRDITDYKNLDKVREDMVYMIYHDIQAPLSNVLSSLELLDEMISLEGDPSKKSLIDIAMRSADRVEKLTSDLLDTKRLETGLPVSELKPLAVKLLVSGAIEQILSSAREKKLKVSVDIPNTIPTVQVDGDMIKRVLVNLLENAVKYTPEGGSITINANSLDAWVTLSVQDTGRGIPAEAQERIFEKFTRIREGATGMTKGLGLGLAFCRMAVEGHGGRIWVESKPGEGSRFSFTLPISNR
jgi:PAS domain S-box-containing protein